MHPWHRWREPLAVALLAALALMLALRGVALGLAIEAGTVGGLFGSIPGGDDLLVLVTAGAVLWCATPVAAPGPVGAPGDAGVEEPTLSEHAWQIAVAGAVIVGLTVFCWLLLSISDVVSLLTWPTPDVGFAMLVIEGLLRLVVPVAALAAVISAVRRAAAFRKRDAGDERPALAGSLTETEGQQPEPPPERLPAAWQADEATGAVWLTADDAAQGRPGLSWTDPGESPPEAGGWARPAATDPATAPGGGAGDAEPHVPAPPPRPGIARSAAEDDDLR